MDQLTFIDGFLVLFFIQSLVIGVLLLLDSTYQNHFFGVFVILYAINSSRIVLYKLASDSAFMEIYQNIQLGGFSFPLLYFFLKSHVKAITKREIFFHSIAPILYLLFATIFNPYPTESKFLSSKQFLLVHYSIVILFSVMYSAMVISTMRTNALWKEIMRRVRLKVLVFVLAIYGFFLFTSVRIILNVLSENSSGSGDVFYNIQRAIFIAIFVVIPLYAYTLLSGFKKFIHPKIIIPTLSADSADFKEQIHQLFNEQKIHARSDLNPNTLANILNIPVRDLRLFFRNHYDKSIPEFITEKRLQEFLDQAEKEESRVYNIEGIAKNAGFNSRPTFYRAFKKKYGMTPVEYLADH